MEIISKSYRRILSLYGIDFNAELKAIAEQSGFAFETVEDISDLISTDAHMLCIFCNVEKLEEILKNKADDLPIILIDTARRINSLDAQVLDKISDICEAPLSANSFRFKLKQWHKQYESFPKALPAEAAFNSLSESINSALLIVDYQGIILKWNQAFFNQFPKLGADFQGRRCSTLFEEMAALFDDEQFFLRYSADGKAQQRQPLKHVFHMKDGRVMEIMNIPVCLENIVYGTIWQFKDISKHIADKKNLIHPEKLLHALVDSSPDPITYKSADGRWLLANSAKLRLLGLEGIDYTNLTDDELMAKEAAGQRLMRMCGECDRKAISEKKISRTDEQFTDLNGIKKIFDVVRRPIFDKDGKLSGLVIIGRDVTERQMALDQLNRSTQWFEQLIESAPNFIVVVTEDLKVRIVNQITISTLGLSAETISKPKWYYDVFSHYERKRIYQKWLRVLSATEAENIIETRLTRSDGQPIDVRWNIRKLKDEEDENHYLFIGVDMTEHYRIKADLMANESRYRRFFEQDITSDFLMYKDGLVIEGNPAFYRLFQLDPNSNKEEKINFLNRISTDKAKERFLQDLKMKHLEKYELT
ncbi:MAG TPA: PAS domain S-box protein, partial [Candidatus Marinimicrobia bacterium]|nr:PAS domain S-box protein [Candidatus Neomarinimicrobiota bacterium]